MRIVTPRLSGLRSRGRLPGVTVSESLTEAQSPKLRSGSDTAREPRRVPEVRARAAGPGRSDYPLYPIWRPGRGRAAAAAGAAVVPGPICI